MALNLNEPSPVIEFQSSALPWVTSSTAPAAGNPVQYDFPYITRMITVMNNGASPNTLSFGFSRRGVVTSNNKIVLGAGQYLTLELRATSIFLQGETGTPAYSICAGLTRIPSASMASLSGSAGVG